MNYGSVFYCLHCEKTETTTRPQRLCKDCRGPMFSVPSDATVCTRCTKASLTGERCRCGGVSIKINASGAWR